MQILDFIRFTVFKWYIINQNSVILVSEQCQHFAPGYYVILFYHTKLRETFPYSEFFCSVFSRIRTEYEEIQGISPYLVRMRGNTVQKNSEYGQFSHKTILYFFFFFFSFWMFPYTTTRQFNVLRTEFAEYWVLFQQKMGAIFYIAFYIYLTMLDINSHLPLAWKYKPSFIPILIVKRTKK